MSLLLGGGGGILRTLGGSVCKVFVILRTMGGSVCIAFMILRTLGDFVISNCEEIQDGSLACDKKLSF